MVTRKEQKDTILVGDGIELASLYGRLKRPERVLGHFCGDADPGQELAVRLGTVDDVPAWLEEQPQVRRVYCCASGLEAVQVLSIQQACKVRDVRLCMVLPVINELDGQFVPMTVGRQLLLTPRREPLSRWYNLCMKRVGDSLVSLILLLTVFPVVYLVRYIVARRHRSGATLRVQRCQGPDGKSFPRLTFRTAAGNLESGWDGLPQLLNVMAGQMSLVGPAPRPISAEVEASRGGELERPFLKSGMTGLAQLKDCEGSDRLRNDIWYVGHWTPWLDLKILLRWKV